jgi:ribosomal-protein-serine acetyltransferase
LAIERRSLSDGRIILRPLSEEDDTFIYEAVCESLEELMPWIRYFHPDYSIDETRTWLEGRETDWKAGTSYDFAIIDAASGELVGVGGLNHVIEEFKMANLGYWVRKTYMGRGIAPAAVRLLAKFGFEELGLNRIEIAADVDNKRSQRVAEKSGARREGVMRKRLLIRDQARDAVMYSLVTEDMQEV